MATVLVVDDDPGIRRFTKMALGLKGDRVHLASDGIEALDILSRESVDLVVLDLLMPRMDGRVTVEEARREGYRGPILILSCCDPRSIATDLHVDSIMEKPFELEEFLSQVNSLLGDIKMTPGLPGRV